jgi:Putative MetA-pathway of phenol degradation
VGAGSSGALRGGWVNAPNGFFSREVDPQYSFTNGHGDAPNEHLGTVTLFTPLSRRLELGVVVPFIDAFNPGQTSFGDVTVIPRFMLSETRDLGVTTGLAIRTPTGDTDTGNGQTRVDPFVAVWADLGHAWQLRSGFDVNVVTDRDVLPGLPDAVLTVNLSIGKTFTLNEGGYFSDITPYLATNFRETFNRGNSKDFSEYDLTPGLRITVMKNVWFITGITFPIALSGPRPFDTNYQFVLSVGW